MIYTTAVVDGGNGFEKSFLTICRHCSMHDVN
jgi:hypothetical protein